MATYPTSAERKRRSRERERLGIRLVAVSLGPQHCEALAAWGLMAAGEKKPERIAAAVTILIGALAAGVVNIDFDAFMAHLRGDISPGETLSAAE